jgi:hypothetical protein
MKNTSIYQHIRASLLLSLFLVFGTAASAQDVAGEWTGVLEIQEQTLHVVFHIAKADEGYTATMDVPEQGAVEIPVTATAFDGAKLSLAVTNAGILYEGELKENSVVGTFSQGGMRFPMTLRQTSRPAPKHTASSMPAGNIRVSGAVHDKATGEAMMAVTVALLDTANHIVAAGATNNEGGFIFTTISAGSYALQVSFVGYEEQRLPVTVAETQTELKLPLIAMAEDSRQLETVTVVARKPLLERRIDKLVMNVADAISTDGSNGTEVLRRAPGLTVDNDGNVQLNGQAVAVWIDNRPSNLSGRDLAAILNSLDGSNIDKIEIISNPSAKYDAAGGAGIINILTKKNFLQGFSGSVQAGGGYYIADDVEGNYRNGNGTLNLNYRNNWMNMAVSGGASGSESFNTLDGNTTFGNIRQEVDNVTKYSYPSHNLRLTSDFFLTKKDIVGVIASGMWNEASFREDANPASLMYLNDALIETSASKGRTTSNTYNYTGNVNYQHLFDGSSHDLLMNFDYMKYNSDNFAEYDNVFDNVLDPTKPPLIFTNKGDKIVDVLSAKVDYNRPLGEKMQLETGGKFARSASDNALLRDDFYNGAWHRDPLMSNTYDYTERISALYASVGAQFNDKWSVKGGLRWENTWSRGNWQKSTGDTTTYQHYNDLFPTLYAGYTMSDKHSFNASYSLRIRRPNYETLNPFRSYAGAYIYNEGNPDLQPAYQHNLSISYTFSRFLNISLIGQHTTQMFTQILSTDTTTAVTSVVWDNFGTFTLAGMQIAFSQMPVTKWWTFNLYLNGFYMESSAPDYTKRLPFGQVYFENTFLMGSTWKAELMGSANSSIAQSYFVAEPMYFASAGVRKTLWDGKGSLSLNIDDIFNTQHARVLSDRNGQQIHTGNKWASRQFRLSFSYRFGKTAAKRTRVGEIEESTRLGSGDER